MREEEIEKIVEYFTEKLYSHQYFIGRKEAQEELGLKTVVNADSALTELMTNLYNEYAAEMELQNAVWNPENELGTNNSQNKKEYKIAFVETLDFPKVYKLTMNFQRQQMMMTQQTPQGPIQIPQEQVGFKVIEQGWK